MSLTRRQILAFTTAILFHHRNAFPYGTEQFTDTLRSAGLDLTGHFLAHFASHYEVLPEITTRVTKQQAQLFSSLPSESARFNLQLSAEIQNDFRRYRTVTVNGWLMSRAEARWVYQLAKAIG